MARTTARCLGTSAASALLVALSGGCSLIYGPDFSVGETDAGGVGSDAGRDGGRFDASAIDAGARDAGLRDAAELDASSLPDAGLDADTALDAATGMDAGDDAGTDAGFDAGHDAGTDAGSDAGHDAGTDAGSDAGHDAGVDAGSDAGRDLVWVANSTLDAVQVVNTAAGGGVVATVAVGVSPKRLVFTPDGATVYASAETGNTVTAIDVATQTVTATIPVGTGPRSLAVTPDGTRVYVGCGGSTAVSVIATATNTVVATIPTGPDGGPISLAIRPDGSELWVANDGHLKVYALPAHTLIYGSAWTDGFVASWARFVPDGSVFWGTSGCGCCGNVQRYSGATHAQLSDHRFGSPARGMAMSDDGSAVYIGYLGSEGGCSGPAGLSRLNGSTGAVALTVSLTKPWAGAVSHDGATLYLSRYDAGFSVVDAAALTVTRTFVIGGIAEDIALPP